MDPLYNSLSSRSSSVATSPSPPSKPTNDDIEAVIQMATSARQTPDGRTAPPRDTRTQLFVGNLPYRVRWQDLKDLFRRAGTVLRADVSLGPDNRSRGYGTVLLASAEDAGRAVDMFNGYSWQTRILEVRPDRLPPDLDASLGGGSGPTVTGFSASTASSLTSSLSMPVHGPNLSLNITKIPDDLDHGIFYSGHDVSLPASSTRNLFVGNLPFHCQWQDLKDLFRQAGTIIRADVALGPDGRSRGFGTVVFATEADAEHAVKMFNGYEYNGRVLKVHFDKFSQTGQPTTASTSPTLHSLHASATTLTSAGLNNLTRPSSFGVAYPSQVSQIKLPFGYHLDYGPPSGPPTPSETFPTQISIPMQSQLSTQSLPLSRRSLDLEVAGITASLGSTNLTSQNVPSSSTALITRQPLASGATVASSVNSSSSNPNANKAPTPPEKSATSSAAHHHHPHHPGPIALPPPAAVHFPLALHKVSATNETTPSAQTPIFNSQFSHQQAIPITPHGLPPITPSMPPFTFLPPPLSPHHYPSSTLPLAQPEVPGNQSYPSGLFTPTNTIPSPLAHPASPAYHAQQHFALGGFSPGVAMSPGAFWGRPGNSNPFINPAVGAPVHGAPPGSPDRAVYPTASIRPIRRSEPNGYFDPEYFPHDVLHSTFVSSSLANEIMRDKPSPEGEDIYLDDSHVNNLDGIVMNESQGNGDGTKMEGSFPYSMGGLWKPTDDDDAHDWEGQESPTTTRIRPESVTDRHSNGSISLSSPISRSSTACEGTESHETKSSDSFASSAGNI